jgi:hypothetical protein
VVITGLRQTVHRKKLESLEWNLLCLLHIFHVCYKFYKITDPGTCIMIITYTSLTSEDYIRC